MSSNRDALMCYIRRLAALPPAEEVSDAALLDRFISARDERAFTALVKRHGAMVLQVCWRILGNGVHAEDAFQATFLVLARKANSVRPREALPAWLHGVARRVALKARAARFRQRATRPLPDAPADKRPDPLAEISGRELLMIVDEEVQRLPERFRLPVVLCCLGGRSLEEAARQLGWTTGSVKGRLERGRARLHDRLVRRGLTLSAALAAVEVSRATTSAAVLAGLVARTIPGALAFGAGQALDAGVSASAAGLAAQVGMTMALPRLCLTAALLLVTAALGAGIGYRLQSSEPEERAQDLSPPANLTALQKPGQQRPDPFWDQSDVPVDVRGRVLDPHGRPVAGAELYVGYSVRPFVRYSMPEKMADEQSHPPSLPRRATTGTDGRFQFRFATSELDPRQLDDARPAVMAIAAGYGPEWTEIGPSPVGNLKLQLVDDLPANGRVLDSRRNPVAGARLVLEGLYSASADELSRFLRMPGRSGGWAPRCWKGAIPGIAPVILTDAEGRWRCAGLGRDRVAAFALDGPKVPHTFLNVATRPGVIAPSSSRFSPLYGLSSDHLAPPVHTIRGTVLDRTTQMPIAGIQVSARPGHATTRTGPDGQFEIFGYSEFTGYGLEAQPESGQGYFASQACQQVQAGSTESTLDLLLIRGIALSGRVTNIDTGKPPKAARVEYYPLSTNQNCKGVSCLNLVPASTAAVRPDGSYSLVVLPGPGFLGVVASPHENYAVADFKNKDLVEFKRQHQGFVGQNETSDLDPIVPIAMGFGQPGPLRISKYHALALINPPLAALSEERDLPVRLAQTVIGTVVGPDGQPINDVEAIGLTVDRLVGERLEGSSFTVTGLNPATTRDLFFQHHGKKLGKVATVRGNATQPVTVQLEPCGAVKGRLVDERGNPMPGAYVAFSEDDSPGCPMATTDALGRFQVDLFPGQKHTWGRPEPLLKDFGTVQVGPGEVRDLGDLALKSRPVRPKILQPQPGVIR
jgi:RNA polymerase sigma factor (sigma-70 family)